MNDGSPATVATGQCHLKMSSAENPSLQNGWKPRAVQCLGIIQIHFWLSVHPPSHHSKQDKQGRGHVLESKPRPSRGHSVPPDTASPRGSFSGQCAHSFCGEAHDLRFPETLRVRSDGIGQLPRQLGLWNIIEYHRHSGFKTEERPW